jgi:Histone-like transcription factor (CBF/NF-Y) and archaeal histone
MTLNSPNSPNDMTLNSPNNPNGMTLNSPNHMDTDNNMINTDNNMIITNNEIVKPKKQPKTTLDQNLLPSSSIQKVCKQVLPLNFMIQKDAKQSLQKATSVFISYLTTTAEGLSSGKTMSVDALLRGLGVLEFDGVLVGLVKDALLLYNQKRYNHTASNKYRACRGICCERKDLIQNSTPRATNTELVEVFEDLIQNSVQPLNITIP